MAYALDLQEIDRTRVASVGGKAALLGELSRLDGIRVPPGFCVTTEAFQRILEGTSLIEQRIAQLVALKPEDREGIRRLSAEIRQAVEEAVIPADVTLAIGRALTSLGDLTACAIRSSGTAEDLPGASFAGQHDSYLNVVGLEAVLQHVSRCWASLFSQRAVTYRVQNGFDHRAVQMGVIVQQMVRAEAAGTLFTADPVTSNRKVASVEAIFGLGEALVSGQANADAFKVRDGRVVARRVATKQSATQASAGGGTEPRDVAPAARDKPVLTDAQAIRLVELGRRVEAHLGQPQDIEWCLAGDGFQFVQSRPITTLFPIPEADDEENHVYVSVGHQQMMTEAMKPLGISVWQLTAMAPMHQAGGRLFVDVARRLASPAIRDGLLEVMGRGDPLTGDALRTIVERGDFLPAPPDPGSPASPPSPVLGAPAQIDTDPAIVTELVERNRASLATLKRDIRTRSGPELFDFLLDAFEEHKRVLGDPLSMQAIMAGMQASWWLNEHMEAWLGEKNAADTLTLSAPGNVTAEMGLALLDVADVIRPYPQVVEFLQHVEDEGGRDEDFLDELASVEGGREAQQAIRAYLEQYGMRCVGEIDITRPRWSERPTTLVPLILDNLRLFTPGEAQRRFEQGREAARGKGVELLERLRALPDGARKAEETERMIARVRTFSGYREYPKYGIVCRYLVYKQALLEEAERLVQAGVLRDREDIFYLTVPELRDLARTGQMDERLIAQRRDAFRTYQALTPPRVLTSEGEVIAGSYRNRDEVPAGALIGIPVSSGTVEGRARVIRDIGQADIRAGDILVTTYTDPSWTPLFPAISALVAEVGGQMTHGAVIAREYGLPAVVGVERATSLIRDGQRIRVDGTGGYVEVLRDSSA